MTQPRQMPLGELTTLISSGSTPMGGANTYLDAGPVLFIRSQNVRMNSLKLGDAAYITEDVHQSMKRTQVHVGDVLLNITGASIGRVAPFFHANTPANVNQHVCIIRPKPGHLDAKYVSYFMSTPRFQAEIDRQQHGGTRQALTFEQISRFRVPLPSLPEQRRIAAILDKADAIRRKRQETIRLTEEFLRSAFLEMFGDPVTNPKGWPTTTLGELLDRIDSGSSPRCEERPADTNEWGVLKLGAVTYCQYDALENKALPLTEKPNPNNEVVAGDLLFTRKNTYELVGATAYVFQTPSRLLLPDLLFRLVPKGDAAISKVFLWEVLTSGNVRLQLKRLASGTSGSMPNISKERLRTLSVPCPPISLQRNFESLVKRAHVHRSHHAEWESVGEILSASLTQRALAGAL